MHVLIVSAEFYPEISAELKAGAIAALKKAKATYDIVIVPGAFEIPGLIGFAIDGKKYDGYIALGCVIRGETTHYDYVCGESARGLMELSLQGAAIGYGILTVENMKQAKARAKVNKGNKGKDATEACLRMIELKKTLGAA
jgi:6,7-dimethyl-8-ribityllumazine synthase